jgi:hypothetical protein
VALLKLRRLHAGFFHIVGAPSLWPVDSD